MASTAKRHWTCALGFLIVFAGLAPASRAADGTRRGGAVVSYPFHQDVSPQLRHIQPIEPGWYDHLFKRAAREPKRFSAGREAARPDAVLQTAPAPQVAVAGGKNFDGVGIPNYGVQYAPPDTNGSVGRSNVGGKGYYVQWVNVAFAVFDKATGAMVYGPAAGNTLWSGFGGGCQTNNDGDPIVTYDKLADRWVFMQFSVSTTPYLQCVAVSKTNDPLGAYNRYAFSYGSLFNDYPKLGIWPDAYYVTYNMFTNTFAGGQVCAMDRAAMLAGTVATQQCVNLGTSIGGLLAADFDGTSAPAAGEPNFVMNFNDAADSLRLWKFKVDWATPANTKLTGPTTLPVAAFGEACAGGTCIPQSGTSNKLDSLGDRLMYRLAYRKFADGHEALVVNHSVGANRKSQTSVRWYEIRDPNGTPVVYQQGTYAPDSSYRWMGSAAMDKAGNIGMGYSVSSSGMKPSIRFTGRGPADPLGTMGAETNLMTGAGAQTGSLHRWGDYSSLSVDPDNDCTMWFTTEYLKAAGSFNWSTRIGSFTLNGCQ